MFAAPKKKDEKMEDERKPDLFTERMLAHEEVIKQRPDAVGFFVGKKKDFGEGALLFEESSGIEKRARTGFEKDVKIELEAMKKKPAKKKGKKAPAKKRKEKDVPPKD